MFINIPATRYTCMLSITFDRWFVCIIAYADEPQHDIRCVRLGRPPDSQGALFWHYRSMFFPG